MERIVIQKDCLIDDICNKSLSDENFIASEDCTWYQGWLYCKDCEARHKPYNFLKKVLDIKKGDDLSKTDLALPMIMEFA